MKDIKCPTCDGWGYYGFEEDTYELIICETCKGKQTISTSLDRIFELFTTIDELRKINEQLGWYQLRTMLMDALDYDGLHPNVAYRIEMEAEAAIDQVHRMLEQEEQIRI